MDNRPYFCHSPLMIKYFFILFLFVSCSPAARFNKDRKAFDAAPTIVTFKSVADMNDSYFVIKENNYFEFYRQLFDSVKNTHYPGKYVRTGDTMVLKFYDKRGAELLGNKAFINTSGNEIIFFNKKPVKKSDLNL